MKLEKDEIIIKDGKTETEYILNTVTKKIKPLPVEKEQITKEEESFPAKIEKLVDAEMEKGVYKTRSEAYTAIMKDFPAMYKAYSWEVTKLCRE